MSMRAQLAGLRRKVRYQVFGNNQPFATNVAHKTYHWMARRASKLPLESFDPSKLATEGYEVFGSQVSLESLTFFQSQLNYLFASPESFSEPTPGLMRLNDTVKLLPEVRNLVSPAIQSAMENYYQSFFKVYWVHVYRTVPSSLAPDYSFLWHVDNCPPQVTKLMVYLTATSEETGAFRLKPKPMSDSVLKSGFFDRHETKEIQATLDEPSTTKVIEGPPGLSILFQNWGCIHKATHPTRNHRDVAVFFITPSTKPWDTHFDRNASWISQRDNVCPSPFFT